MKKEKQTEKKSLCRIFRELIHKEIKEKRETSYEKIFEEYYYLYKPNHGYVYYEECIKHAMVEISTALKSQGLELIRKGSNKKGFSYSYPEGASDIIDQWLDKKSHDKKRMRLTEIIKLFAMSKGLLPDSWIVNLTPQIKALESVEISKKKIIEFDSNDQLINIYKIPTFLDAIENEKVLSFEYNAGYQHIISIVFTPYYIKEYNHRFFCIGFCKNDEITEGKEDYVIAIDRIVSEIRECSDDYNPPQKDYSHFYEDIVGVRHEIDKKGQLMEKQHILIETRNIYTHGRIISKPLHSSQKEEKKFGEANNGIGMISIDVVPNMELTSLLLSFGSNIKVVAPQLVVERIANNARRIVSLYE